MDSTAQLLVVSPDTTVLEAAQRSLLALGHVPVLAPNVPRAQRMLTRVLVDLICLDSLLPVPEMEALWRWLCLGRRQALPPLLLLAPPSARLVPAALPPFFQPERDALVPKPLEGPELAREVARLLAARPLQRRGPELLRAGSLTLDAETQQLFFADGGSLSLTPTETRLLRYLMRRPGDCVPLEELLEHVWDYSPGTGGAEVVRSHVSNLRRKLHGLGRDPQLVRTIPYQGYAVSPDVAPAPQV